MKLKMKRFLGILLSFTLMLGLMPGMSLTAYAAPTETLLTTITATGNEQANYSTANVATVSFSYTAGGSSAYLANWGWWGYGWTATVNAAEGYTITKCVFYDDANRTATDSSSPFVVKTTEEDKTPQVNDTPILAYTSKGIKKIEMYGYATPAHTHDFTYAASGATITATCSNTGCTLTANPTLTIVKPTLETYGQTGKSAAATLTGLEAFNTVTGKSIAATDIKYVGRAGTTYAESATAPSNAGKYTAKLTLTGVKTSAGDNKSVTASVDYEIAGTARKTEEEPLKEVPDELKSLYTVQQIEKKLLANLMINGQAPSPGQTVFKNVELMISHDGGKTWVKATKYTFPKGGITVELDYPEGTNGREYRFAVAHMLTVAMNGMKAGDIEKPEVVTTDKKLRVTLNGLSPVAISWTKIDNQAIDSLPQTGDTERPLVYGLAVLAACIGLGVLIKRNNKK